MTPNSTKDKLRHLLKQGLSEREIARHTGIPRTTIRQRIHALGTCEGHTRGRKPCNAPLSEGHRETPLPHELLEAWEDLKEVQAWWRARKQALQTAHAHQEIQRQTYDVQTRYIAAIACAADAEGVSSMAMVNRAFQQYFYERSLLE
jgi:hypothetical protein